MVSPMKKIEMIVIHPSIVFWSIGTLLFFFLLYSVRSMVAVFLLGLILAAAMAPAIRRMKRHGIPRGWSVLILYLCLLACIVGFLAYLIPIFVSQMESMTKNLPRHIEEVYKAFPLLQSWLGSAESLTYSTATDASTLVSSVFSKTVDIIHYFISLVAILTIAFYLSIEEKGIRRFFSSVTPSKYQDYVVSRAEMVYHKIGTWMLAQFVVMFSVFLLAFLLLFTLKVPYAFILAFLVGILEVIPYIGPILSAIPAILLGFTVSPIVGVLVTVGYIVIQQVEGHVLVPQIMKRAVGLHPIVVILVLLAGAKLGGIIGAFLAVPLATAANVFIQDIFEKKNDSIVSPSTE